MPYRFYKAHNIKFGRPKEVYRKALRHKPRLDEMRKEFALLLANILAAGKAVIYVDETTFTSKITKKRTWQFPKEPNLMPFGDSWMTQTVFGAISPHLRAPVWYLGSSTNAEDFCKFLDKIKNQLRFHVEKPVIIFDGASAHTSGQAKLKLSQHFKPLMMPPYSCEFNSIEHVWAISKSNFVKLCLIEERIITKTIFDELILKSLNMISQQ